MAFRLQIDWFPIILSFNGWKLCPAILLIGERHLRYGKLRRYVEPMVLPVIRWSRCAAGFALAALWTTLPSLAQSNNADAFDSLLHQGFDLHQQARFSEAIPVLNKARQLEPNDYFVNLLLGIDLLRTGETAQAVPRLQASARAKPDEEFPQDYLGEAEATLGRYAAAAEAFERATQRGHNSEQALEAWAGFALERFHSIGEELRGSEQGLAVARRLQAAASGKETTIREQQCDAAIPLLERRMAASQQVDTDAAFRLSICYAMEAGMVAGRLGTSADDMAALHRLRGDVLLRLKNDPEAAETEYRQALSLRPRDPQLLERMAEAQLSTGNTEGARSSALAALAIDPHRQAALRTLASIAMNDRNYEQALPLLKEVSAQAPNDRAIAVELGRALSETGDSAGALRLIDPALQAGYPDEKGALHALLARVLRRLGRDAEAEQAANEARRLSDAFQAHSAQHGGHDANKTQTAAKPDAN
jgi:predicted Zn-dependent protease